MENETEQRKVALAHAAAHAQNAAGSFNTPEVIIERAQKYYDFLTGVKAQEDAGST